MDLVIARTLGLLVIAIVVAIAARRMHLPYTVGLVIAGIALTLSHLDTEIRLTREMIFDIILPPLLFEAAINIPTHELRRDLIPILILSVFGVIISAGVVAGGLAWFLAWSIAPAIIFGVLIAATDPVAVIAMFKDVGLKGRLRLLVECESLFNDGVAAVLFGLALAWSQGHAGTLLDGLGLLLVVAGGGLATGLVVGGSALLVSAGTADRIVEGAVTAVAAYGAFLLAEYFGFSGVLATVSAGLFMGRVGINGRRTRFSFSAHGQTMILELWDFAAFIANSLIFLLIGLATARVPFSTLGLKSLAITIAFVLLGRGATVFPLAALFSRSRWQLSMSDQYVLWWGGLRGALALALALSLPDNLPRRDDIFIMTFAAVAFSVVAQGATMHILLRRLRLLPGGK